MPGFRPPAAPPPAALALTVPAFEVSSVACACGKSSPRAREEWERFQCGPGAGCFPRTGALAPVVFGAYAAPLFVPLLQAAASPGAQLLASRPRCP